ncbi:hypothetical protein M422DRAFT_27202 [Sphaerobolus stellatus SS14]|nr:hypothetical protein M422DRAFT_27202 [Sphaerobolus stellatus SS14]
MFTRSFPSPKRPNNSFTPSVSRASVHTPPVHHLALAQPAKARPLRSGTGSSKKSTKSAPHPTCGLAVTVARRPSSATLPPQAPAPARRCPSDSAPEISAFNNMFDLIFNAVNETSKPVEAMKSSKARARTAVAPEA